MHHHPVTRLDLPDAWPDLDNFAAPFVPEKVWNVRIRALSPADLVDLLAADPTIFYSD
jgi:hypothetical protein